jgi:hypothetical protein
MTGKVVVGQEGDEDGEKGRPSLTRCHPSSESPEPSAKSLTGRPDGELTTGFAETCQRAIVLTPSCVACFATAITRLSIFYFCPSLLRSS